MKRRSSLVKRISKEPHLANREALLVEERKAVQEDRQSVKLCRSPLFAADLAADHFGKIGGTRAEKQERSDQKIHGYRRHGHHRTW